MALMLLLGSCAHPAPLPSDGPSAVATSIEARAGAVSSPAPVVDAGAVVPTTPAPGTFEAARAVLLAKAPSTIDDLRAAVAGAPETCKIAGRAAPDLRKCTWTLPARGRPRNIEAIIDAKDHVVHFVVDDGVARSGADYVVIGIME